MLNISTAIKYRILFRSSLLFLGVKLGLISRRTCSETLRQFKLKRLEKKYKTVLSNFSPTEEKREYSKTIWTTWLQGIDQAPEIVQKCYKSIKDNSQGFDVVLLTDENFSEYVDIPDFMLEKYKSGIISKAHFSDVLRTYLMVQKGGIWLDSTALLTEKIPSYVFEKNFFFFNHDFTREPSLTFNSSWFIFSTKGNNIFRLATQLLEEHLKSGNKWDDYFLFHLFVKMTQKVLPNEWDNLLFRTDITPHVLQLYLAKDYNEYEYNDILKQCFVHKLTHKVDEEAKQNKNSIYNHILKN